MIENWVHRVHHDATEGEDHSGVQTGTEPQVMAALRNPPITIIRLRGDPDLVAAQLAFSYQPANVIAVLTAA